MDLLARRAHFRRELEAKLRARSYEEAEIEAALVRLEELGHVDDAATARQWLEERTRQGGWGRRRLRAELERRGADPDLAATVVSEMVPEEDPSEVAVAVERWLARGGKSRRSLARHLERRGFSKRHILDALESVRLPG
ncbi:MAG: recombination regulator RecX [Holophagales bacterium]|nr:recombination regulator RecX [Holophagales bacterium]